MNRNYLRFGPKTLWLVMYNDENEIFDPENYTTHPTKKEAKEHARWLETSWGGKAVVTKYERVLSLRDSLRPGAMKG